jgi:hypothetical protein
MMRWMMSKLITELSKEELLNLIYNNYDAFTYDVCFCVMCEKSNIDHELGYICDDCQKRLSDE